jgi:hypothetical protein
VDEEEFPGYLDLIGGRANAMDLATMEEKLEGGKYRTVEQFEVSSKLLSRSDDADHRCDRSTSTR